MCADATAGDKKGHKEERGAAFTLTSRLLDSVSPQDRSKHQDAGRLCFDKSTQCRSENLLVVAWSETSTTGQ